MSIPMVPLPSIGQHINHQLITCPYSLFEIFLVHLCLKMSNICCMNPRSVPMEASELYYVLKTAKIPGCTFLPTWRLFNHLLSYSNPFL